MIKSGITFEAKTAGTVEIQKCIFLNVSNLKAVIYFNLNLHSVCSDTVQN